MNNELDIYKQKRINNLKNVFNNNVALLNSSLTLNIKNVNLSRTMNSKIKQTKVNIIFSFYDFKKE